MEKSLVEIFAEEREKKQKKTAEKETKLRKLAPNEVRANTPDGKTVVIAYHLT